MFALDPSVTFLNHGSFGSCPTGVLAYQQELRERMEREPVTFFLRDLERLLDDARASLGKFIGARSDDLAFLPNATTAVNTVLQSLRLAPGDELLTTNHEYNACLNAMRFWAERASAKVVVAEVPFPVRDAGQVVEAVLGQVTARTRFALIDHVTSPTGLVFPLEALVPVLERRGVATMIDGAHAPGMVPFSLDALGASFATGNLHKWVCAPKGAGYLHVRADLQQQVRPLVISHGANSPRSDRSRFRLEFDWLGTLDPTAWLCVPKALEVMAGLHPRGWDGVREANHALVVEGRAVLLRALGLDAPAPDSMLGSLASVILPRGPTGPGGLLIDPLQEALFREHRIEVPVFTFGTARCLRISAQRYNTLADYEKLARVLPGLL